MRHLMAIKHYLLPTIVLRAACSSSDDGGDTGGGSAVLLNDSVHPQTT